MRRNSYTSARARALGFRSGFESDVADALTNLGVKYEYENPVTCCFNYYKPVVKGRLLDKEWQEVKLEKGTKVVQLKTYTTDFVIYKADGKTPHFFVETKGKLTSTDRNKHKLIKEQYPDVDLRILFQSDGKATPKLRYSEWCANFKIKYGFIKRKTKSDPGFFFEQSWIEDLRECLIKK